MCKRMILTLCACVCARARVCESVRERERGGWDVLFPVFIGK